MPARLVAAVEATVAHADVLAWYAGAMAELDAVVREPVGPVGGLYDNALFTHGRGHVLVHVPISAPVPAVGRVRSVRLPEAELAVAVHAGAHDTIDVTYGELGRWVADHALAVAGPVRETYLAGPRDTPGRGPLADGDRLAGVPRHRRGVNGRRSPYGVEHGRARVTDACGVAGRHRRRPRCADRPRHGRPGGRRELNRPTARLVGTIRELVRSSGAATS
ncbi:hypothetical protein GCM10020295_78680 [Streptomyces cinereospinus]